MGIEALLAFRKNNVGSSTSTSSSSSSSSSSVSSPTSGSTTPSSSSSSSSSKSTSPYNDSKAGKYSSLFSTENDERGSISDDYESVLSRLGIDDADEHDKKGIRKMLNKERGNLTYDMNHDGILDTVDTAQAIANSFDSVLDLYIQKEVQYCVKKFGRSTGLDGYLSDEALAYLKSKHIEVNDVENSALNGKVWAFSLVDDNGNILQDENGNLGSCIFADGLNADGYMEDIEMQFPSILDELGYDCLSRADFNGTDEEYEAMLQKIEAAIQSGEYQPSDESRRDVFGEIYNTITRIGASKKNTDALNEELDDSDSLTSKERAQKLKMEYEKRLQAKIKSYKLKKGKDGISETELKMLETELNSDLLKDNKCSLDEVKKAQKATHGKIETTDGEKQSTETSNEQVIISNATENEIDKEEKEEQTV